MRRTGTSTPSRVRTRPLRAVAAIAGLALLAATPARAQWTAVPSETFTDSGSDAQVKSDDGAELRIWLDLDNYVHARFRLPPGLLALDPEGCPTFQIDDEPAENLAGPSYRCTVAGPGARVVLTRARSGTVQSPTLLNLMNGSRLVVRFRMAHAGYGEYGFTLRGSKQALTRALGEDITVAGRQ